MAGFTISKANSVLTQPNAMREFKTDIINSPEFSGGGIKQADQGKGVDFGETLQSAIDEVNTLQKTADFKMQELATGKSNNIPDVMIAVEKADIAMKLMMSVRNKMIEAYQEVMKMQL